MLSETQLMIADGVAKNGWFVVNYEPTGGSSDPDEMFSYTVGLAQTAGWPEIIVFGLDPERSLALLGDLLQQCWKHKHRPTAGMTITGILPDAPIKLIAFDADAPRYFHFADWYARHASVNRPARLQLIWPDRDGLLPDDSRCDAAVGAKQQPLGRA